MNLLDETKGAISQSEHSTDDVRFVGSRDEKLGIPWSQAEKVLDIDYDNGYGSQEIAADLVVAFTDINFAANYFDKTIGERRLTDIQLALNDVYEHYVAMTKAVEHIQQIGEELIAEGIKEVDDEQ